MLHNFAKVPKLDIPRSVFNLSSGYLSTLDENGIVPVFWMDVLPGDSVHASGTYLSRMTSTLRPFMDNLFLDTFYFNVPFRLVWDNWEKLCGQQDNPGDSTDYLVPQIRLPLFARFDKSLFQYFGGVPQAGQTALANGYEIVQNSSSYVPLCYKLASRTGIYSAGHDYNGSKDLAVRDVYFIRKSDGQKIMRFSDTVSAADPNQTVDTYDEWFNLMTKEEIVTSLLFRAYNLIYNEWYRDENLIDSLPVYKGDQNDNIFDYLHFYDVVTELSESGTSLIWSDNPNGLVVCEFKPYPRGKRHDYFTSCLPWPQKGPSVNLPMGLSAPVNLANGAVKVFGDVNQAMVLNNGHAYMGLADGDYNTLQGCQNQFEGIKPGDPKVYSAASPAGIYYGLCPDHRFSGIKGQLADLTGTADLSAASTVTINELREAFAIQRMYEKDARGGTRYTEVLQNHFGVTNPDLRLQRPEYIGGNSVSFSGQTVVQTSSASNQSPQGNLSGNSSVVSNNGFQHSFTEFGCVLGFVNIRADLTYQQGKNRFFSKRTRFDFYWPGLGHLGEQAVLNKEIFSGTPQDNDVFGYIPRYDEYRCKLSYVTGRMTSVNELTVDQWHLSQKFENLPRLNYEFMNEAVPISRIVSQEDQPHFYFNAYWRIKAARPISIDGVPGLMDHF